MSASPEEVYDDNPAVENNEGEHDVVDAVAQMSDDESVLSDVDEAQFEDFDPENVAVDDRPALDIDEENLRLVGRHKRSRKEGEGEEKKKKKKEGKREKKSRRRQEEEGLSDGGGEGAGSKKRRSGARGERQRQAPEIDEESLDPATREYWFVLEALVLTGQDAGSLSIA